MKRYVFLFAVLALLCPQVVVGQLQTTITTPDGNTLWFRATAEGAVVTHAIVSWPYYAAGQRPCGAVTLPDSVAFGDRVLPVVEVGRNAFYNCDSLSSIALGRHVKRIATQAFNGCVALKNVSLPDSLHAIGEGAFAYCRSLSELNVPSTVDSVGMSAFSMCTGLRRVNLPTSGAAHIDGTAFHGCSVLEREDKEQ
ncbi:MAG: leucine-rich repeat domain-containing protein [Bacteroidales bacterium]|nr:leucine-rich repeat domain-containing protein [Bacteroidales bacterium]MBR1799857.1 leucine-rich repeat domain-containing protein [Bacteroidales bacterium]MBR1850709.1 leucine-rich repeat domain-containing protein [Bacteroidales bacterium]